MLCNTCSRFLYADVNTCENIGAKLYQHSRKLTSLSSAANSVHTLLSFCYSSNAFFYPHLSLLISFNGSFSLFLFPSHITLSPNTRGIVTFFLLSCYFPPPFIASYFITYNASPIFTIQSTLGILQFIIVYLLLFLLLLLNPMSLCSS